jgi:hypothetical protein
MKVQLLREIRSKCKYFFEKGYFCIIYKDNVRSIPFFHAYHVDKDQYFFENYINSFARVMRSKKLEKLAKQKLIARLSKKHNLK